MAGGPAFAGKCPICNSPAVHEYRPFCCKRCADVDLNRWLSGGYAIPASQDEPDEDDLAGDLERE
mgnify:CR=1 FL=1